MGGRLAEAARWRLVSLGYRNVHVLHGDRTLCWAEQAPYDAIIVTAGGPECPGRSSITLPPGAG